MVELMKPKMGRYYKISFYRFGQWVEQPGVAKCIGVFKQWVSWNYKSSIKYVPMFIYRKVFLSVHDCTFREVKK